MLTWEHLYILLFLSAYLSFRKPFLNSFFYSIIHVMTYFFHNPFDYFCALSLCFACKDQFAVIRR